MSKSLQQVREDFDRNGFEFLMTLDTALAFTKGAESSLDPESKERNVTNARKAYDAVIRLREKLHLDAEQRRALDDRQSDVKNALEQLGERF